ncbi:MAG: hypothetical protein AAF433_14715 [Bacteroidota bacterium]
MLDKSNSAFFRLLLISQLLFGLGQSLWAENSYRFGATAQGIYDQIMGLELEPARAALAIYQANEPNNLVSDHLASYADVLYLYLSEDKAAMARFKEEQDERLERAADSDKASPWHRYVQAELRLHRAVVYIRFEKLYPAFRELNKAHKLLRDNAREHPEFLLTYKDLGLVHAAVGAVPPQYRWGLELLSSLNGTIEQGAAEMEKLLDGDPQTPFYQEAQVLYAFVQLYLLNDGEKAWELAQEWRFRPERNKLECFVLSTLAMRTGRNDRAIELLETQPRGGSAQDFPYLDFMLGLVKLRSLDSAARLHFQSFLLRFRGDNFRKAARQKMAWAELLRGNPDGYREQMSQLEGRGNNRAGGDRNATKESQRTQLPNLSLLRARLLFDGAYFQRARAEMDAIDLAELEDPEEILEYYYRTGRILHGMQEFDGALSFYERTISLGAEDDSFFACNAALQAGLIEEERGKDSRARAYFERCLSLNPDEYKAGLHLQAKAGLDRL